ncbi:uncharacterized protein LOC126597429 [Malus sylvestris]|uniref:uncharacterized protein LOC126597429 n=1 Tax=Malus sylvestris TaxID=3752 RepID=UPI0021ACDDE6|nr:uncharacterized protein LOC126597429 [Malus sylvestris]
MGYEPRRKMETKGVSALGGDQEFLFNRNLSRNSSSSLGCSSRVYYCRSTEGVPFNWEMQPGTPRNPPKEEVIPPISPPPAVLSLGLPKPCIDQHPRSNKPPTSPLHRLKFWTKKSKKNKQRKNNFQHNVNVVGESDKFDKVEFCSSDSEFMASSTSPRNSSSSFSSSFSFSKGQCASLRSTPARDLFTSSSHFSCSPWKFS